MLLRLPVNANVCGCRQCVTTCRLGRIVVYPLVPLVLSKRLILCQSGYMLPA